MLNVIVTLVFCPILILTSVLIGLRLGHERKIGFWWTLFFCISLSPLVGIGIALVSPLKTDKPLYSEFVRTVILGLTFISLVAGIVSLIKASLDLNQSFVFLYWIGTGLVGLAIYGFLELSKIEIKEEN